MADEDDVLTIKVVGDYSEFDEGIRQRESNGPRQSTLSGPATFGSETGNVRQSPALQTTAMTIFDASRQFNPFGGTASSGSSGFTRAGSDGSGRLEVAIDRLALAMERTAYAPPSPGGGGSGLIRYSPPVQRGGGPDEILDAEYGPASQLGRFFGGGGRGGFIGGGGQLALPGPGGGGGGGGGGGYAGTVNIPNAAGGGFFGPPGGGGGGGGGGWQNFPPYRPNRPPFNFGGGGINWNRNIMPTGQYYAAMFGLFEVGHAYRASEEGEINAATANDPFQALQARVNAIHGETGGIFGSIAGLGMDLSYRAGIASDSPVNEERTLKAEEARYRFLEEGAGFARGARSAGRIRAAIGGGSNAVSAARDAAAQEAEEATLTTRRAFLSQQLTSFTTKWGWGTFKSDEDGLMHEGFGDIRTPLVTDAGQRAAMQSDIAGINAQIASGRAQVLFNEGERDKDTAYGMMVLTARGADAADFATLSPHQAGMNSLLRRQGLEFAQMMREHPELSQNLSAAQTNEYNAESLRLTRIDTVAEIVSQGNVLVSNLSGQRRPYEAERARLRAGADAARLSPENATDPAAQQRITSELTASLTALGQLHDYGISSSNLGLRNATAALGFATNNMPYNARLTGIQGEWDSAVRAIPQDEMDKRKPDVDAYYKARISQMDKEEVDNVGMTNLNMTSRAKILRDLMDRNPAGAEADATAAASESEIVRQRIAGHPDQAAAAAKLGIGSIELRRRNYFEAFRGEQLDLRDFRVDNPRDKENPGEVNKSMDAAIKQISETLSGSNEAFFQKLGQTIQTLIAN